MPRTAAIIDSKSTCTPKPMLVYDGDCTFCYYSVQYWQKLTGDRVNYQPYQAVAQQYPAISIDEFKRAVQYITPDGHVASAAEASFLTLNNAKGGSLYLTLYRKLPGFAWASEFAYRIISTHRNLFYKLSLIGWGRHPEPPTYDLVTWIFLRLFGLLFLAAFYSFSTQALGLIGSQGIIPVASLVDAAQTQLGSAAYWRLPFLFWISASDTSIQLVCWSGIALSLLLIFNIFPRMCLIGVYILYLSLVYGSQVFMSFQWDMLLLETALIAFFLIRYRTLGIWLLRWLVFRFIFVSGIVKVASGDPTWWGLTALDYHFLTQPLPTPLAWYMYYAPPLLLKILTFASLAIELVLPFLIFSPRRLRFAAGFFILAMQAGIILTGNYNFFNFTTVVLCLALFDDAAIKTLLPQGLTRLMQQRILSRKPFKLMNILAVAFTVITITASICQFNLRFVGVAPTLSAYLNSFTAPYLIVNTYGPFAVMTTKRYEIIIEGSNDGKNWREYEFKYKPGDIYKAPRWNIPFQPRLDWQMWFAALGPAQASPWFANFLQRLLENSSPVTALLADNPFPDAPPIFIRALYYDYTYTTEAEYKATKAWWNRWLASAYFPTVSLPTS